MVARPAAVPRAKEVPAGAERPAAESAPAPEAQQPAGLPTESRAAKKDLPPLEFSDFVFSESSPQYILDADVDPVDAEAEEAAILYANAQDEAVSAVLESSVRIHQFGPGERLWLMLFDFYRLSGKKAEFEALGIEFARCFEKSPPAWRDKSKPKPKAKEAVAAGNLLFSGGLTGDNISAFDAICRMLEKNPKLRLDLSKVGCLDAGGCGRMLEILLQARKSKCELDLLGRDGLFKLVEQQVVVGRPDNEACWLLLLELCQLQGMNDYFEEMAINYAVTFEVSPPSWDAGRVAPPESAAKMNGQGATEIPGEAYVLRGEIKASRFADLSGYAGVHDPVIIDCSELIRIDFISAGALLNVLTTIRNAGKQIVFHHPNHLVAELFGVVGLKAVASIVFSNN